MLDGADQFVVLEHRHCNECACAAQFGEVGEGSIPPAVSRLLCYVGDVHDPSRPRDASKRGVGGRIDDRLALPLLDKLARRVMQRTEAPRVAVTQP